MCKKCVEQGKMKIVGIVTDEEHAEYILLWNKISCGEQASRIDSIPANINPDVVRAYIGGVIEDLARNKALMRGWFEKVGKRLGQPDPTVLSYGDTDRTVYENLQMTCPTPKE